MIKLSGSLDTVLMVAVIDHYNIIDVIPENVVTDRETRKLARLEVEFF